jgi:hypothetical protein
MHRPQFFILLILLWIVLCNTTAQNPIIRDQFTADPSARVFGDKVYVYPSHDILCTEDRGRVGWFCMEDYHVFSSPNLTDWTDHGVIVNQSKIDWVDSTSFSMWAPDCIYRNGKYYFYFPSRPWDTIYGRGFTIGVAIAEHPEGPFIPNAKPIKNVHGIDPNVFIDKDEQAYLYWSARKIFVARLQENMFELASEPEVIDNLPKEGLIEGPFLFERNGIYYLTYPHAANKTERLEYATADNPMGPFKATGVIMDELPSGCWTNHQSIIQFKDQWYLFYHSNDLSPAFDKNRSVCIDSLFFNDDGTIQEVTPTLRGVGLTDASQKIEIDRYSYKSNSGVSIAFFDTLNSLGGWKTILEERNAWIQYNGVDFRRKNYKTVQVRVLAKNGGTLQIGLVKHDASRLTEVNVPVCMEWITIDAPVVRIRQGIQNLIIENLDNNPVEIDWIQFIK